MKTFIEYSLISCIIILKSMVIFGFDIDFKSLKNYLNEEKSILESFDTYLSSEEQRISRLRQMYEHFRQQNSIALKDKDLFVSHPNDVYFIIKRITIEWRNAEELLEPNKRELNDFKIMSLSKNKYIFNFTKAVEDYEKIIYFYESDIEMAANGLIKYKTSSGEKVFKSISNQTFNSFDCYLMGRQSYNKKDYFVARQWLNIALEMVENRTTDKLQADILEYLFLTEYQAGNYVYALEYLNHSLVISPERKMNEIMLEKLKLDMKSNKLSPSTNDENVSAIDEETLEPDLTKELEVLINTKQEQFNNEKSNSTIESTNNTEEDVIITKELQENSDYLCMGQKFLNDSMQSKLKCFHLNTTSKPFLRLTRIKVEEIYKRPQILLIHNFFSESDVEKLKNISEPRFQKLQVVNETGDAFISEERIAEGVFFYENSTEDNFIERIAQKISAITGLNASDASADGLNVIHYNVGGLFQIHHDTTTNTSNPTSNRIATWINYLSDVQAGGATVFPKLNVSFFPEKYSAVFWHNLFSSGDFDGDLIHTGCPVLYGDKWIATKWIYARRQALDVKCALNRKEYKYIQ